MKVLHDAALRLDQLRDESFALFGSYPTDEFVGTVLHVEEARSIGESLQVPGLTTARVVVCSFESVLPRSFDALLQPVESSDARIIFSCSSPTPETFRSRFQNVDGLIPSVPELYIEFAAIGRQRAVDDVVDEHPELPASHVRQLYDSFVQSSGPVSEFIACVHDGNQEGALRAALGFKQSEIDLLHADLEMQLLDSSLTQTVLSRVTKEKLLATTALREVRIDLTPTSRAALILHTLL